MFEANAVRFYLCSLPSALFGVIVVLSVVWLWAEIRNAPYGEE
jgi:hypothetical protein